MANTTNATYAQCMMRGGGHNQEFILIGFIFYGMVQILISMMDGCIDEIFNSNTELYRIKTYNLKFGFHKIRQYNS